MLGSSVTPDALFPAAMEAAPKSLSEGFYLDDSAVPAPDLGYRQLGLDKELAITSISAGV